MWIVDLFKTKKEESSKPQAAPTSPRIPEVGALISSWSIPAEWDGEKEIGNVGPIKKYIPSYERLRDRSWQLYLDADLAKTVLNRYIIWVVKNGLRLQSTPVAEYIKQAHGIPSNFNAEAFSRDIEQKFDLWQSSELSTYNKLKSFKQYQPTIYKNAIVGGDVLIILRRKNGVVNVQAIDGSHLKCENTKMLDDGNKIINGIEFNKEGEHVAYHVTIKNKAVRVAAYEDETGLRVAWLQYGSEHRLDNHRGIPIIATAIEAIAKTDRYKDATIDQAEEIRKLAYAITHDKNSDGANPLTEVMGEMMDVELDDQSIKRFESGEKIAKNVAFITGRNAVNLGIGSDIKNLDAKNELYFKDFYTILAEGVASTIGIPPNVAFSKYNDSFSASRAATKDWENTIDWARTDFDNQTLGYVFNYWFYWECWSGRIQAPGYVSAHDKNDIYLKGAFTKHRFVGPKFPHIDPVKEATAARLLMGTDLAHIPLTTGTDMSEMMMTGEFDTNVERAAREKQITEGLGIKPKPTKVEQPKNEGVD